MVYLDNNASTPLSPAVKAAIVAAMSKLDGNPSSTHLSGRKTRHYIEHVRENLAQWFDVYPEQVFFTSGATEANNIVLQSVTQQGHKPCVVTTPVEHPSVLQVLALIEDTGISVQFLKIARDGLVDLEELDLLLQSHPNLVSIQWVNNETGVIQPIERIIQMCSSYDVPLHVDAAQAVGKFPIDLSQNAPDFFTFSGHKLHAPAGIGALICKDSSSLRPLLIGGGQESGLRSGTENWLGIIGLGAAITDRQENFGEHIDHMASLRGNFEDELLTQLPFIRIMGQDAPRVPNTSNILFSGVDGQALVAQLNGLDIFCSQTSACNNQRPEPSYVLRAMGLNEQDAYSCVRFSVSPLNTSEEINEAVRIITECAKRLLAFSGGVG